MADRSPPPDDSDADKTAADLVAYLDGELDADAAESLANRLGREPKLRTEADELQRAWDALDLLPRPRPSSTFASRTLTQVLPVGAGLSATGIELPGTARSLPYGRPGRAFWAASLIIIATSGVAGYLGRGLLVTNRAADPPLEDVGLLKNLRFYRHVDDMDYLRRLDRPELFGEESP